ncbi:LytR/AlgR family response regulator transcription factor [Flammeovirga pacifica]|uniref:DNA-binding response regulator n=1 Tax=Flammeovirga pacifica TaxID=915059 RepID=A0A1S1YYQ6_FLAPC|nr:LytTR family DNA-binding domain-containing protein [Flammeovirga pacifica]OHX66063.1 DNA-binding response regulator [Flammeovirga pacifica]
MEKQKTYKCLIVDDEQLARNLISVYLSKLPFLEEVAACASPIEAMQVMRNQEVDILLLDIQMPELTGLDLVKSLSDPPVVIFTTAYSEYAVDSYNLNAIDYLLKPFGLDRFIKAINKAIEWIDLKSDKVEAISKEEVLLIKGDQKTHKVNPSSIKYIEGLKEYVSYYLKSNERIVSLYSLTKLEKELEQYEFLRVHRSYIINKNEVTAFEKHMVWIGDKEIPIGKTYRDRIFKTLSEK